MIDNRPNFNSGIGLALEMASFLGYIEIVEILVRKGADVNARVGQALYLASKKGFSDIVKVMIDEGDVSDASKSRARKVAAEKGHLDIVKLLSFKKGFRNKIKSIKVAAKKAFNKIFG